MKEIYRVPVGRFCPVDGCEGRLDRVLREFDPFPGEVDSAVVMASLCCKKCSYEHEVPLTHREREHPLEYRTHRESFAVAAPEVALS